MPAFQNRRFRFQVADKLWRECAGLVTPEQIVEIADSVEEELSGHRDGLAFSFHDRAPRVHREAGASDLCLGLDASDRSREH
jgi:hypothetical protein